jgi:hypothetical protein
MLLFSVRAELGVPVTAGGGHHGDVRGGKDALGEVEDHALLDTRLAGGLHHLVHQRLGAQPPAAQELLDCDPLSRSRLPVVGERGELGLGEGTPGAHGRQHQLEVGVHARQ